MAQEESSREVHRERRGAARPARPVGAPARVPVPLKSVARNLHKSVEWRIAAPIVFRYLRCIPFDNVCRVRRRDFGADWVLRGHGLHFVAARSEHSGKGSFFGFCRASCAASLVRDREAGRYASRACSQKPCRASSCDLCALPIFQFPRGRLACGEICAIDREDRKGRELVLHDLTCTEVQAN
jgi:hypothetical protein